MKIDPSIPALRAHIADLETVLRFYVDAFPAFRSKPVGAPGSVERKAQNVHIDYENLARKFLTPADGEGEAHGVD